MNRMFLPLRCDSSLARSRKYAKNRGRRAPGFVLKGAIQLRTLRPQDEKRLVAGQ
jgi:hypothetical protein